LTLIEVISKFEFVNPAAIDKFYARGLRYELDYVPAAHLFNPFDLLDHRLKPFFIAWCFAARGVIT